MIPDSDGWCDDYCGLDSGDNIGDDDGNKFYDYCTYAYEVIVTASVVITMVLMQTWNKHSVYNLFIDDDTIQSLH